MNAKVWPKIVHVGCWLTVAVFTVTAIGYGIFAYHTLYAPRKPGEWGLICGNTIIDPLIFLLRWIAPVAGVAAVTSILRWRPGVAYYWSPVVAAGLFTVTLVCLLTYGVGLFQNELEGFMHLSDIVWWMRPWGRLFGF